MRVAIPLVSLKAHGGVRLLVNIANYLEERGFEVVMFVPQGRVDTPFHVRVRVKEVHPLRYIFQIRNFDPELVIYNFFLTAYLFPFLKGCRGIYFVQDYEPNFYPRFHPFKYLSGFTYRFPLRKIATSRWLMERTGAVDFVYPGVDTRTFTFAPRNTFEGRILMFPRRHPHKGLDRILEISPVLKEKGYELLFATRDISLESVLGRYGRIVIPRSDDELVSLYHDVDVLLYTTRMEAFGLPLFEAMATGTPFITSHYPVLDELLPDEIRKCCVLREFGISRILDVLERMEDADFRRGLVEKGRRLIEDKFNLQHFLIDFYRKAIAL